MTYNESQRNFMTTGRAASIQLEVDQLIDLQIKTLNQNSSLTSSELFDYHARSRKLEGLCRELDKIKRTELVE